MRGLNCFVRVGVNLARGCKGGGWSTDYDLGFVARVVV